MANFISGGNAGTFTINDGNVANGPFVLAPAIARSADGDLFEVTETLADQPARIVVAGLGIAGEDGIDASTSDGFDTFTVTASGSIFADGDGIVTAEGGNLIDIAGSIDAGDDGLNIGGTGANLVTVSGSIASEDDSVRVDGDGNVVAISGSIASATDDGVEINGNFNFVNVSGSITADDEGVEISGNDNEVTVSGEIFTFDDDGIDFFGDNNRAVVSGSVNAADSSGMEVSGNGTEIEIDGSVRGFQSGISLFGDDAKITIGATGVVRGGDAGGLTSAVTFDDLGGVLGAGVSQLVNHGSLISDTVSEVTNTAVAVWDFSGQSQDFTNTGDVQGDVLLQGGNDTMTNSGTVVGNISLGTGNDVFTSIGTGVVTGKIDGGTGFDTFKGGDFSDTFFGGAQADTMQGGGGSDQLFGEAGNDLIIADLDGAQDVYDGGADTDTLTYATAVTSVTANLGLNFAFGSEIGVDKIVNIENLVGGSGDDSLVGAGTTLTLSGGAGNDTLQGGTGSNTLLGGDGNDTIRGFAGFDKITGGAGNDTLSGDFNADTFIFANGFGKDVITDFDEFNNAEKIDLAGVTNIADFADLTANHLTQVGTSAVITDGADTITLLNVNIADLDTNDFIF